ncbi:hypothetical protein M9Y10_044609 [Tritrichomonas musculus]|uniref:Uncharacterized protein n=1 Tax=Tritrichomonas musculus TaxID=1915356 RepID=A0ABR2JSU4_9EUKA
MTEKSKRKQTKPDHKDNDDNTENDNRKDEKLVNSDDLQDKKDQIIIKESTEQNTQKKIEIYEKKLTENIKQDRSYFIILIIFILILVGAAVIRNEIDFQKYTD